MKDAIKENKKIIVTFGILLAAVVVILLLVFFAGKKTYTVTFDLDGGTLVSGDLEQKVVKGQDAAPPSAKKDGMYISGWTKSYRQITEDVVITAQWSHSVSTGIEYFTTGGQNYSSVIGSYEYIKGIVYLDSSFSDKRIIEIGDGAFADRVYITEVKLRSGIISIGTDAFCGCTALTDVALPKTVTHIEDGAWRGCSSLERVELNDGLVSIGAEAFRDCTSLKEIIIPASVKSIGKDAFLGCEDIVITIVAETFEMPEGFADGWSGDAEIIWESPVKEGVEGE